MADLKKTFALKPQDVKITPLVLGTMVVKFDLPMNLIDDINRAYDERGKNMPDWNTELAGKIKEEKLVDEIFTDEMKESFLWCFQQYLKLIECQVPYFPVLSKAWINEMKSGEYNPIHYHTSPKSVVGLSSVLMLKRPDWYGVEASREQVPANGWLEFTGGDQAPLSASQIRMDAQVGDFYVFPYTVTHGVYPFNSTNQKRRTLSYNCDLLRPVKDTEKDNG